MNDAGLALLKSFEGCKLEAYQDQVGVWTIGYGHTGDDVYEGLTITQEQADALLAQDLNKFEPGVKDLVDVSLNDNQLAALIDFAYNLGLGALKSSFLLKCVNAGNFEAAAAQFPKWDHAGGQVVTGLLRRREAERDLFQLTATD